MIHVAQAARLLGSEPRFGALEPPPTATALSRTSLLAGKGGKAFGGVLADSTLLATGEYHRRLAIGQDGGVDLA